MTKLVEEKIKFKQYIRNLNSELWSKRRTDFTKLEGMRGCSSVDDD